MLKVILVSMTLFINVVKASEYTTLLTIINTGENDTATLFLKVDHDQLNGLKLVTSERTSNYSYRQVVAGTTLVRKSGISIISIKAPQINKSFGGKIQLTYLKSFSLLGSDYGYINLFINKKNGYWALSSNGKEVRKLYLDPHPYGITSYLFE